jgi:hypothetical protein
MQSYLPLANPSPSNKVQMRQSVESGIVRNMACHQHAMMEGIIKDTCDSKSRDRFEPVVAEGSYIGAPTIRKGSKMPVYKGRKGGFNAGMVMPVAQ